VKERTNEVNKGNHCAWSIHYQIVFPVKYRKALLDREVVEIIRATAEGIQERYEIEMERMGMDNDHIHLLCGAHPKIAVGKIVQVFKSITAREIFKQKPAVKKDLWAVSFGLMDTMPERQANMVTGEASNVTSYRKANLEKN
jgi:putative transposase